MKYYIIAGEASGDLHASNLMAQLKLMDDSASFRCWGGDRMLAQGGVLVRHIRELAFMGFWEVLINLRTILRNMAWCKKDVLAYNPDVLILVDYPGFNLRMAAFAKKHGIRTVYYISPQIWAWNQSRVHQIKRDVDKMLVILPFEKDFYERFGYDVVFTGHPLLDALEYGHEPSVFDATTFRQSNQLPGKPLVAVLPGSRKQEISRMLKVMLSVTKKFPDHHFVIAGLSTFPDTTYRKLIAAANVSIVYDQTYELLKHSHAAMVTSGTATLETALFKVPQLVCYRSSPVTFMIARRVVKVPYISLVNLIMDKPVVKELIQQQCSNQLLALELDKLLHDEAYRQRIIADYELLHQTLGGPGASKRAAEEVTG